MILPHYFQLEQTKDRNIGQDQQRIENWHQVSPKSASKDVVQLGRKFPQEAKLWNTGPEVADIFIMPRAIVFMFTVLLLVIIFSFYNASGNCLHIYSATIGYHFLFL